MTTLQTLFPDGPRMRAVDGFDAAFTEHRLAATIGAPRSARRRVVTTNVPQLVAMVDAAARDASPTVGAPTGMRPKSVRRRRKGRDWLSIVAAFFAVVAMATAGALVAVRAANASPAADALRVLGSYEAEIVNMEESLRTIPVSIEEERQTALDEAAALRVALEGVREVPNPRAESASVAATVPVIDGAQLDAMIAELDAFAAALGEVVTPELPEPYVRGALDESSLDAVAEAINAAQATLTEMDGVAASLRAERRDLRGLIEDAGAVMADFAVGFASFAATANEANPDAADEVAEAMTAAGAAVSTSRLAGDAGVSALAQYRDAFSALIADQLRVELEREEAARQQREAERNRQNQNNGNEGGQQPGPSDPGPGGPTDPGPTDPTDPDPTDP